MHRKKLWHLEGAFVTIAHTHVYPFLKILKDIPSVTNIFIMPETFNSSACSYIIKKHILPPSFRQPYGPNFS